MAAGKSWPARQQTLTSSDEHFWDILAKAVGAPLRWRPWTRGYKLKRLSLPNQNLKTSNTGNNSVRQTATQSGGRGPEHGAGSPGRPWNAGRAPVGTVPRAYREHALPLYTLSFRKRHGRPAPSVPTPRRDGSPKCDQYLKGQVKAEWKPVQAHAAPPVLGQQEPEARVPARQPQRVGRAERGPAGFSASSCPLPCDTDPAFGNTKPRRLTWGAKGTLTTPAGTSSRVPAEKGPNATDAAAAAAPESARPHARGLVVPPRRECQDPEQPAGKRSSTSLTRLDPKFRGAGRPLRFHPLDAFSRRLFYKKQSSQIQNSFTQAFFFLS